MSKDKKLIFIDSGSEYPGILRFGFKEEDVDYEEIAELEITIYKINIYRGNDKKIQEKLKEHGTENIVSVIETYGDWIKEVKEYGDHNHNINNHVAELIIVLMTNCYSTYCLDYTVKDLVESFPQF